MDRTNSPSCNYAADKPTKNLLASLTVEYMSNIKIVLVNKPCVPISDADAAISAADAALVTLKRHLEDPDKLSVLHVEGEGRNPIFNRTDIIVNNEESIEERIELTPLGSTKNEPKNKKKHSRSSSVSSQDSTSSIGSTENPKRMPKYNRTAAINPVKFKLRLYGQKDICKVYIHTKEHNTIKEKEQSRKISKCMRILDREVKEKSKCSADSGDNNCREYSKRGYKSDSSENENKNSRRSNCFRDSNDKYRRDKNTRSRSRSSTKYGRSPPNKRLYSSYCRKCSCSPKPDSESQKETHSNEKTERERKQLLSRRKSSHEKEMDNASHSKRNHAREKRSPSPHSRRNRRSPHRRSSTKHSSQSRRSFQCEDRRNKSPSKNENQFRAYPYHFGYYGAEGLWLPGQFQRPHLMPRNVIPTHMSMVGGMSYFIPRSYISSVPRFHHRVRPRGVPYRHRMAMANEFPAAPRAGGSSSIQSPNVREEPSSTSDHNDRADST